MDDRRLLRYGRHILLEDIGVEGQERLQAATALIVGAGGLGSPAAMYLAAAGVGTLLIADGDTVDLSNLQRQILHRDDAVGQPKVESGARTLFALHPEVRVEPIHERLAGAALAAAVARSQVVLDCSDNFATRHAVNAACVAHGVPLVSGAAIGFDGQVAVYDSRIEGAPCYGCLFPPSSAHQDVACATMGVFAPLVGLIGSVQAAEALKLLAGIGTPLAGRLLMLDARRMRWDELAVARQPGCEVCGGH